MRQTADSHYYRARYDPVALCWGLEDILRYEEQK